MDIMTIIKSNLNVFSALVKSKKFVLTTVWLVACLMIAVDKTFDPKLSLAALISGTATVVFYTIGQALLEIIALKKGKDIT